jgi:8-oxo-dGTP diphosphatase
MGWRNMRGDPDCTCELTTEQNCPLHCNRDETPFPTGDATKVYVAGLLFDGPNVALVRKQHPPYQRGLLNGIGGKVGVGPGVDPNETPDQAMIREFEEEAGPYITDWRKFCVLHGDGWVVHWYVSFGKHELKRGHYPSSAPNDFEQVDWHPLCTLGEQKCMLNLAWLVPLAIANGDHFADVRVL